MNEEKVNRMPARRSLSKLMALLYCITVVLLGLMFPLTEALRNKWHESPTHLLFQILLYTVAVLFMLYLQFRLIPLSLAKKRKAKEEAAKDFKRVSVNVNFNKASFSSFNGSVNKGYDSGWAGSSIKTGDDDVFYMENLESGNARYQKKSSRTRIISNSSERTTNSVRFTIPTNAMPVSFSTTGLNNGGLPRKTSENFYPGIIKMSLKSPSSTDNMQKLSGGSKSEFTRPASNSISSESGAVFSFPSSSDSVNSSISKKSNSLSEENSGKKFNKEDENVKITETTSFRGLSSNNSDMIPENTKGSLEIVERNAAVADLTVQRNEMEQDLEIQRNEMGQDLTRPSIRGQLDEDGQQLKLSTSACQGYKAGIDNTNTIDIEIGEHNSNKDTTDNTYTSNKNHNYRDSDNDISNNNENGRDSVIVNCNKITNNIRERVNNNYNNVTNSTVDNNENDEDEIFIDLSTFGHVFSNQGSNLYLRFGALIFSLCNMVYIGLEIDNGIRLQYEIHCPGLNYWWIFIFRFVFLLVQSFLIFKNASIQICVQQPVARFGFMHLIATNMCVWLHTITNEIMEEYHMVTSNDYNGIHNNSDTGSGVNNASVSYNTPGGLLLMENNQMLLSETTVMSEEECQYFTGVLEDAASYLFPFVLEYSFIAIGTLAIIISSISEDGPRSAIRGLQNFIQVQNVEVWSPTNLDDTASVSTNSSDKHEGLELEKSHRGLFLGILLLAGNIIGVFMFYFIIDQRDLIYYCTELTTHTLLLVATFLALAKLSQLSFIDKPVTVDDVFIMIAMCGSFLFELTLIISSSSYLGNSLPGDQAYSVEAVKLSSALVAALQTLAQTVLVIIGVRCYPNKEEHVKDKPGRGTLTFLILGNVVVWISRTLQSNVVSYHTEYDFYGLIATLLLLDTNLPILLFFRFHSSICLADIWSTAYTPLHTVLQHHQQRHKQP